MGFLALRSALLALATALPMTAALAAQATALRNVTVIDVAAGSHLRDRTVLIDGGRITALGDAGSIALPRGTRVIDGRGKYLIPGMWDMHLHLGMGGRSTLPLLVATGVLGVRDMGDAFERIKAWRDSIASGSLLGPRLEMVGPIIENAQWLTRVSTMLNQQGETESARSLGERIGVSTPDEARAAVDRVAVLGVSMIKVRNAPPPPRRRYLSTELARTWRRHMDMKRLEGAQPDWDLLNRQTAAHLRAMDSLGVTILSGTDLGGPLIYPGFGLHDELSRMVREGGMTPARALRAATLSPAQFLGLENELGTVAPGMDGPFGTLF
ncbi:MAG: amidohydrolase family protein [Gemmatimonadaceae bacterium]